VFASTPKQNFLNLSKRPEDYFNPTTPPSMNNSNLLSPNLTFKADEKAIMNFKTHFLSFLKHKSPPRYNQEHIYAYVLHTFPIYLLGFSLIPSFSFSQFLFLHLISFSHILLLTSSTLPQNTCSTFLKILLIPVSSVMFSQIISQTGIIAIMLTFTAPLSVLYFTNKKLKAFITFTAQLAANKLFFEPLFVSESKYTAQTIVLSDLFSWITFMSLIAISLTFLIYVSSSVKVQEKETQIEEVLQDQQPNNQQNNHGDEISNEFIKKVKQLEKLLEQRDNSLLTVSHECRNPLNGIQSNLELAQTILLDERVLEEAQLEKIRSFIHNAKICGDVLLHYINNILDSAKIETNGIEITPAPVDIRTTFEKVWAICSESIRKKNLVGTLTLDRKVPLYLNIDSHRLIQVLVNIINNSIKFTKKGAITVRISWREEDDPGSISPETRTPISVRGSSKTLSVVMPRNPQSGRKTSSDIFTGDNFTHRSKTYNFALLQQQKEQAKYVLNFEQKRFGIVEQDKRVLDRFEDRDGTLIISIMDTGCGVSEENLPKLFQKFSQVNADPSKRKVGTGLGLWLCKHIVEGMKGTIEVKSQEDFGTSFLMAIPTQTCENLRVQSVPSELSSSLIEKSSAKRIRGIVLGTDDYSRKVHTTFLEKCNCEVALDTNNEMTAYNFFKGQQHGEIEVILIDLGNRKPSEVGICKAIRDYEAKQGLSPCLIVVLGTEAHQKSGFAQQVEALNFDYCLKLPCSLVDIKAVVDRALLRRTPRVSSRRMSMSRSFRNKKVLVIDDDGFCLEVAKNFFENVQIECLTARDSDEGLEILKRYSEDIGCILVDYEMPGRNGQETMNLIREYWRQENKREVPVFCCTGNAAGEFMEKVQSAGFSNVYEKPINWRLLVNDVKKIIESSPC